MFITISRQFAAGGSEVSRRVAEELGWKVVDDAFIEEIAARTGYTPEDIADLEERVPSFMERFAQSSTISLPEYLLSSPSWVDEPETIKLAHVTRQLVQELGREDRVVLVGRAAAAVLASESSAIHVRLVASVEYRVQQATLRLGHSEKEVQAQLAETDRNRERYHRELYGRDWNDPVNYHLVLNTEAIGPDGAAQLIVARARQLGW